MRLLKAPEKLEATKIKFNKGDWIILQSPIFI